MDNGTSGPIRKCTKCRTTTDKWLSNFCSHCGTPLKAIPVFINQPIVSTKEVVRKALEKLK